MEHVINIANKPNIIVVGDIFLDHTFYGSVSRIANEAPVPVYKHDREVWSLGGAGNVLANLAQMGCNQLFAFGRTGSATDYNTTKITSLLTKYNITNKLIYDDDVSTIVKNRYYCGKTMMFRHDQETVSWLSSTQEDTMLEQINKLILNPETPINCIVFSDYNRGFLTHRLCQSIVNLAQTRGIFTCVDPKEDATKYTGCSLIKPNRAETLKLFGVQVEGKDTKHAHEVIHKVVGCTDSVITLSEHGATLSGSGSTSIIHCANQPMEVIDVTGAGDIVCATLAYLYPKHSNKQEILKVANILAMISVTHLSSYVLHLPDFINCGALMNKEKRIEASKLRTILDVLHEEKQTSVFTNGCFDIIHVGHLDLLKRCKEMGNIVIVGLNSDASISRLKGPERPINALEKRVAFLSALTYVDYIVVFEQDTPAELLAQLRPSILVKGGDYTVEQLVGREHAGEVRIVPFISGYSSTSVIRAAQASHSM
jgi:D-beta-D-heptose 7-phosphate kinase/D-beta-D-heptose 1-phosphate adenosyltransferase